MQDHAVKLGVLALAGLGAIQVLKAMYGVSSSFMKYIVLPRHNFAERYGKGSWAVVTGGSDGIGKQYALAFAKEGFNIVIMGL